MFTLPFTQSVDFTELVALYSTSAACIVSSLRDGMNLVAYEYVACQQANKGVLVLSEFAGAAQALGAGCIRVNPYDTRELARGLYQVLRFKYMRHFHRVRVQG